MSLSMTLLVLSWVVLAALCFGTAGLLRELRELQRTVAELGPAPRHGVVGKRIPGLVAGSGAPTRQTVALVVDGGCGACPDALRGLAESALQADGRRFVVVAYSDTLEWHVSEQVGVIADPDLFQELDLPWRPGLLTVDPDGTVTTAVGVSSADDVRRRLATAAQLASRQSS